MGFTNFPADAKQLPARVGHPYPTCNGYEANSPAVSSAVRRVCAAGTHAVADAKFPRVRVGCAATHSINQRCKSQNRRHGNRIARGCL